MKVKEGESDRKERYQAKVLALVLAVLASLAIPFAAYAQPHPTQTTVSCTSPVVVGQMTICTATVQDVWQTPTERITPLGTVTFTSSGTGNFTGNPCTLSGSGDTSSCNVNYTPTDRGTGTHTITGDYSGDANHQPSSGSFNLIVNKADTTTTITSDIPDPSVTGQPVTVTFTVTVNPPGGGTPTGNVTVTDGTDSCTGTVATGSCTLTLTTAGAKTLTATYAGDANFNGSSDTEPHTVNKADTMTTITSDSPDPSVADQAITVNFSVTANPPGSGTPTGDVTVTINDGSGASCTGTLVGGNGSCSLTPANPGSWTLTATYPGDANFNGSSDTEPHQVNPRSTSTSVSCVPSTIVVNQATTCTATVTDTDAGTKSPPSGTVTFSRSGDGSGSFSPSNTCTLSASGPDQSNCSVTYTPSTAHANPNTPGTHTITASYGGSNKHASSSGNTNVTVNPRQTSTSISCTPGTVVPTQSSTCTATVTDIDPNGTPSRPSGTVSFNNTGSQGSGSFSPSSCTLSPVGPPNSSLCSVTYTPSTANDSVNGEPGIHQINGSYSGSSVHAVSNGTFNLTVNPRQTSTSVSCTFDYPPNYVRAGNTKTCTATVTDTETAGTKSAPSGTVTFSTTGSGSFSPTSCTLFPIGPYASQCRVDYTPAAGSDGVHTITASYGGSNVHDDSSGNTQLRVDGTPPTINPAQHTNTTCFPTASCDTPPETVQAGTYVKALDQAFPFIPKSTFEYDVTDPTVGGVSSGLQSCTLSGTQQDGLYTPGTNFNIATGDGAKSFSITCQDNVGNSSNNVSPSLNVDDTPPAINNPEHTNTTCFPTARCDGPPETVFANTYVKAFTQANPPVPASTFRYLATDPLVGGVASGLPAGNVCNPGLSGTQQDGPYTVGNNFNIAPPDGPKTFTLTCRDNLNNQSSNTSPTLIVDDTPPTIADPRHQNTTCYPYDRCDAASETLVAGTYVKAKDQASVASVYPSVPASLFDYYPISDPPAGSSPGSGLKICMLSGTQSDGPYTAGTDFRITIGDGIKHFSLYCDDNLGNRSVKDSPPLNVDDTPPVIPNNLIHTNTTCWTFDRCNSPPEIVVAGTWVKAVDKQPFTPSNPFLPPYPQFIPKSTFQWPQTFVGTIDDPIINAVASGLRDCVLTRGTTRDNIIVNPPFPDTFSATVGDGPRTFRDNCRDNLGNQAFTDGATINVDDTPPTTTFTTSGPRYDDPSDGTIFVKSNTIIMPILVDAGVGVDLTGIGGPPADIGPTNPPCKQNVDLDMGPTLACQTPFSFLPPDRDHHYWINRPDLLGNVAESHFIFIVDDTPPQIKVITPVEQGEYLLHQTVLAEWEVTDNISFFPSVPPPFAPGLQPRGSGIRSVVATTPNGQPIDTTSVGAKAFTIAVTDNLGHQTTVIITYRVVYDFYIDPELKKALAEGRFRVGDKIRLAFQLRDAHGVIIPDARPIISLVDPATGQQVLDFGQNNRAEFDKDAKEYVFTLDTAGLAAGQYEIRIQPEDTTTRKLKLVLQ